MTTDKSRAFAMAWHWVTGQPIESSGWVAEYRFHSERKWRADWAHEKTRVIVEVDGGNHMARIVGDRAVAIGRHTKPADLDKVNTAASMGWAVFRFTPEMLRDDPARCINLVLHRMGIKHD